MILFSFWYDDYYGNHGFCHSKKPIQLRLKGKLVTPNYTDILAGPRTTSHGVKLKIKKV